MNKKIVVIALLTLTVIACNTAQKAKDAAARNEKILNSTSWDLVKLKGKTISIPDDDAKRIYFSMLAHNKWVSGSSGCNNFMGSYIIEEDNHINFSPMASTRKACPDLEVKESEVLKVFERADMYTLQEDKLILRDSLEKTLAVFKKAEETSPKITEKYWKLKTLDGQEVKMTNKQEREQYFMLKNNNNRIKGFSGCNSFSGEFTLEKGKHIHFSKMASTMKACPDVVVDESAFLKVFEQADNYTIDGDTLKLNVDHTPLAVFEAVYF